MRKKLIILLSIMIIISSISILLTRLTKSSFQENKDKITIVTSFYPIYVATSNVVADIDEVELINLTENQTGCLHDYQITTQDMKKLENADIFIINGGGIEEFAEDIVKNYPNIKVIDSSVGVEFLPAIEEHHEEEKGEEEHDHGEFNPHIWLDPDNYMIQIENIKKGLIEYNKANSKKYSENAVQYQAKIEQLNDEIETELDQPKNKDIVIFHDSFDYLAKKLGLNVIHTVDIEADTTLSAGELAEVIDEVKANNVKVLFSEEQYSTDIPTNVALETGANVYVIDSLVISDGDKDSYIEGMKQNISILKEALYQ